MCWIDEIGLGKRVARTLPVGGGEQEYIVLVGMHA
jgi:hypothetical protein